MIGQAVEGLGGIFLLRGYDWAGGGGSRGYIPIERL
jgi:hypothetical protein